MFYLKELFCFSLVGELNGLGLALISTVFFLILLLMHLLHLAGPSPPTFRQGHRCPKTHSYCDFWYPKLLNHKIWVLGPFLQLSLLLLVVSIICPVVKTAQLGEYVDSSPSTSGLRFRVQCLGPAEFCWLRSRILQSAGIEMTSSYSLRLQ